MQNDRPISGTKVSSYQYFIKPSNDPTVPVPFANVDYYHTATLFHRSENLPDTHTIPVRSHRPGTYSICISEDDHSHASTWSTTLCLSPRVISGRR